MTDPTPYEQQQAAIGRLLTSTPTPVATIAHAAGVTVLQATHHLVLLAMRGQASEGPSGCWAAAAPHGR